MTIIPATFGTNEHPLIYGEDYWYTCEKCGEPIEDLASSVKTEKICGGLLKLVCFRLFGGVQTVFEYNWHKDCFEEQYD